MVCFSLLGYSKSIVLVSGKHHLYMVLVCGLHMDFIKTPLIRFVVCGEDDCVQCKRNSDKVEW